MVVMVLALGYLVGGAYFGLSLLILPLGLMVRPFNRRLYYNRIVAFVFGNYWVSCLYVLEQLNGTKVRLLSCPKPHRASHQVVPARGSNTCP